MMHGQKNKKKKLHHVQSDYGEKWHLITHSMDQSPWQANRFSASQEIPRIFVEPGVWSGHGASSGCGWRNGLRIWRVSAITLNKQPRRADKVWSSSLGVG